MPWVGSLMIGLILLAWAGRQPVHGPDHATTVIDGLDRHVSIAAPPQRIVSIFASNTELLYAIGAGPSIIGIEEKTHFPPEVRTLPRVGGRLGFSAEHIAALDADLVVLTTARHAAATLLDPLASVGVPAVVLQHRDLEQIFTNITLLGRATGRDAAAAQASATLRARLAAVAAGIAGRAPVRCYLETGSAGASGFSTPADGTYTADALRWAGGVSVFSGRRSGLPVSGESVLLADPEVIVVCGDASTVAALRRRPGWDAIAAVRDGRVYAVPRALLLIPGPRIIDGVEQLAAVLHHP